MPPTRPADRDMWRIIAVPLIIWGRSLRHLCLLTAGIPKAVSTGSHIQCLTGIISARISLILPTKKRPVSLSRGMPTAIFQYHCPSTSRGRSDDISTGMDAPNYPIWRRRLKIGISQLCRSTYCVLWQGSSSCPCNLAPRLDSSRTTSRNSPPPFSHWHTPWRS